MDIAKVTTTDEMIALRQQEQADEEGKQGYCAEKLAETKDEGKSLVAGVKSLKGALSGFKNQLGATGERLEAVTKSATELDARRGIDKPPK